MAADPAADAPAASRELAALATEAQTLFRAGDVPVTPADALFAPRAPADAAPAVEADAIPALFGGALLAGRFEVATFIAAGAFGRGWVALDRARGGRRVFLKTFRCDGDCDGVPPKAAGHREASLRREIDILLAGADTVLPRHPAVVAGTLVCYGAVAVPRTGREVRPSARRGYPPSHSPPRGACSSRCRTICARAASCLATWSATTG
jgi:hypothetical protein